MYVITDDLYMWFLVASMIQLRRLIEVPHKERVLKTVVYAGIMHVPSPRHPQLKRYHVTEPDIQKQMHKYSHYGNTTIAKTYTYRSKMTSWISLSLSS